MIREKTGEVQTRVVENKFLKIELAGVKKVLAISRAYTEGVVADLVQEIGEGTCSNPQILQFIREIAMRTVHKTIEAAGALIGMLIGPHGKKPIKTKWVTLLRVYIIYRRQ